LEGEESNYTSLAGSVWGGFCIGERGMSLMKEMSGGQRLLGYFSARQKRAFKIPSRDGIRRVIVELLWI